MIVLYILLGVALLLCAAVYVLFRYVNDGSVPLARKKEGFQTPGTALAVFAHPDDEIMVSGTLSQWKKSGAQIHLLYFTRGEDGPTGGLVEKKDLGDRRELELQDVARILQADSLTLLRYPDRHLSEVKQETLEAELLKKIDAVRPDTVISFDNTIGLYGHADHAFAGLCTQAFLAKTPMCVKQLMVMTLSSRMIALALKVSKTFKERYHAENGLPAADLAVSIRRAGAAKKRVCLAHKTQRQVVGDVQPFVTKLPAFLYYRIFSREYFHFIKL